MDSKKRFVTLVFKREELIYDAENIAFVEGDVMETENEHARHQLQDIAQKGNIDRVSRILNLAYSECVEMMYPYTKEECSELPEVLDDKLETPEEYRIELSLPENFSKTTVNLIKDLMHDYLVCSVLSDWMGITNPGSKKKWEDKQKAIREKVQTSVLSRRKVLKRKLRPF